MAFIRHLFVCVLAITVSLKASGQKKELLRVAAYNVEYSKKGTAAEIAAMLKPYRFDIICFSEAPGGNWTTQVAEALGMKYTAVGQYSTAGHKDKYKTIVSRTPLYDQEEVLMADTLHTATKAFTRVKGKTLAVYAVHFPFGWRDQAHIDETTHKITVFANHVKQHKPNEVALIMGDFNFLLSTPTYESPYYEQFVAMGMRASWVDLARDVTAKSSMVSSKPDPQRRGRVIDHIFYPGYAFKAVKGGIIELDKPLSDHKPVWAELQVR